MNITPIFANLLIQDNINLDNDKLVQFAHKIKINTDGRSFTNRGGWQSRFVELEPEVQGLISEINDRLDSLRQVIKFKKNTKLKVESMWININLPYSYNISHVHPGSYISGAYYVSVPENSGNIEFKHPSNLQPIFTPRDSLEEYNAFNSSKWVITPSSSQLIMFPSWLEHGVSQNLSDEARISIAFNAEFYND
jgi:uncharacterized protein (TIGR02466 family)